jgi:2-keto-4-pentenoate hydratase
VDTVVTREPISPGPRHARLAAALWQAVVRRDPIDAPSAAGDDLSLDDAYAVQALVTAQATAAGAARRGWKVALSSEGAQRALGASEPAFGALFASMEVPDGGTLDRAARIRPLVEAEVAVLMGRGLAGAPGREEVRRAVAGVRPAIEIADSRIRGRLTAADCVADNGSAGAFVLGGGDWTPLGDRDLAAVEVLVDLGGPDPVSGRGSAVLGDPLAALAWLAGALTERTGRGLQPGDVVMTGSLHPPVSVRGPETVEARFTDLGHVSCAIR